jgi:hypothetical protein
MPLLLLREGLWTVNGKAVRACADATLLFEHRADAPPGASFRTNERNVLAGQRNREDNQTMRALVAILVACALLFGVYHYYLKKMPTTDEGTAPTQAISLTGVRGDLLQMAQAERGYIAQNGHCATLEELTSSNALAMSRPERDGYSYTIECSGGNFSVTARHAPAPEGSPIRYPALAIDQTMQVLEVK